VSGPRLLIELPLEGEPSVRLFAETAEDELRLLDWLMRAREVCHLGDTVIDSLDVYEREGR